MNLSAWLCRLLGHDWDSEGWYKENTDVLVEKQFCNRCGGKGEVPFLRGEILPSKRHKFGGLYNED